MYADSRWLQILWQFFSLRGGLFLLLLNLRVACDCGTSRKWCCVSSGFSFYGNWLFLPWSLRIPSLGVLSCVRGFQWAQSHHAVRNSRLATWRESPWGGRRGGQGSLSRMPAPAIQVIPDETETVWGRKELSFSVLSEFWSVESWHKILSCCFKLLSFCLLCSNG